MGHYQYMLFLGNGRYNLTLIAEAISRRMAEDNVRVFSASLRPSTLHPQAIQVMQEIGIDLTNLKHRSLGEIQGYPLDLVITLGDFNPSDTLNLPGMPPTYHWDIPVPSQNDTEKALKEWRETRDYLYSRICEVFSSRMLYGLHIARRNLELVLDNLADGVMVHTNNRRIFYFNQAAEKITGYRREDLLGKDCHKVFRPNRFCGGDCSFCNGPTSEASPISPKRRQVSFQHKDGNQRIFDMTVKPLSDAQNVHIGALVSFKDSTELDALKKRVHHYHTCGELIARDPKMLSLFDEIREVGPFQVPVFIEGESGTGKELVARAIHQLSDRANKPFIAVNCGALPEGILESELFGHVRGAFTGAVRNQKGRFELADGGTIFLDEIGELSSAMQVKLLRVLQEKSFERVGGEKPISVDVRVLSATNRNLHRLMEQKKFRRDLFYRMCVVPILVPPLRERRMDIPTLVDHFLSLVSKETGKPLINLSTQALDTLTQYPWPGNVRELRNVIEYAYVKCRESTLLPRHLPKEVIAFQRNPEPATHPGPQHKLNREQVSRVLAKTRGNKSQAAALLGVGRSTLYRFLKRHNLESQT